MFDRKRINDSKNSPVSNVTSFVPTLILFRSHERIPCIRASFCERDVRTRAREMLWRIHRKNVAKMRDLPWTNEDRIVVITRKPWGQRGGRVRDSDVRFDRKGMQTVKGGKISLLDSFENSSPPGRRPFICRFRGVRAQNREKFHDRQGGLVWLRFLIHSIFTPTLAGI